MKARRLTALLLAAAVTSAALPMTASAEATPHKADYEDVEVNFAKLLQYSLYFYDANMCGTDVSENNLLPWRGDCHAYDAAVPLQPMTDEEIGTNLSASFISKYKDILDPDGDGCVDVSGGFHDRSLRSGRSILGNPRQRDRGKSTGAIPSDQRSGICPFLSRRFTDPIRSDADLYE